ncbi:MAG: DUF3772 domain-containing protein [Pseudomonadota bacterium]
MIKRFVIALLLCVFNASIGAAQSLDAFDAVSFNIVADRSQEVLDNEVASDDALLDMRAILVEWREAATASEDRRSARVDTALSQLNALGPAPADGSTESLATAAQRENLEARLNEAQTPVLEAQSAFERANGLIGEIDALLRSRQTDRIVTIGPNPLSPQNWIAAGTALVGYFADVSDEIQDTIARPASRQLILERLPVTIFYLLVAVLLMWPRRALALWDRMHPKSLFGKAIGLQSLFRSFLVLVSPIIGIFVLVFALEGSSVFGLNGQKILQGIPAFGVFVVIGVWLGWVVKRETPPLNDEDLDPTRFQWLTGALGIGVGLASLLSEIFGDREVNLVVNAVLRFPLTLLFAAVLAGIWFLTKPGRWLGQALTTRDGPFARALPIARAAMLGLVILMPMIAVIGYGILATNLLLAVLSTLALLTICYVTFILISRVSRRLDPKAELNEGGARNTGVLLRFGLGLIIACLAAPVLALIWGARTTDLQEIWGQFQSGFALGDAQVTPSDIFTLLIVFAVGFTITRVVQSTLRKTVLPNTSLDNGAQYAVVAGTGYVGIFIASVVAISATGLDLSSLAIIFGALSVGIGFGLQNIVSNFISGIILLVERPIKEGDWIEVGGQHGTVKNISVRSTEVETFDRSVVIIPNSDLMTGTLTNYTHRSLIGRVIVPVGVSYDVDPREVERILLDIAENHPRVLLNPAPYVVFQGFGDSSMDFEVRAILRDVNWVLTVRSDINFEIAKRFKEAGIEIPFAQSDITIRNLDELKETFSSS